MIGKIGVRAHDFGRKNERDLAYEIRRAGFDCVQLALTKAIDGIDSFDMITESRVDKIREAFSKEGVEISVMGCYVEPAYIDHDVRLKHVQNFCNGVRFAKLLGVPVIATETTSFPFEGEREPAYERLKDSVMRMVEVAEREDVLIGLEPVALHTLNTPSLMARLQQEVSSEKLKVVFDPVNMIIPNTVERQTSIFKEFLDTLGDDIVALHMKDVVVEGDNMVWRNIGSGVVDYKPIIHWLRKSERSIPLLREGVKPSSCQVDIDFIKGFYKSFS